MPENNATDETPFELIQVDGTWLPGIREYNVTLEDIDTDDTNRSESGVMSRNILRSNVYHANVTHICTEEQAIEICTAVKADSTIQITALCPGKGSPYETFDAYVSKLQMQFVTNTWGNWWQIDYQLIEV